MTIRSRWLCGVVVLALSLLGCTKAAQIIEPDPGSAAPWNPDDRGNLSFNNFPDGVFGFAVKFHPDFNPESFRAELDGFDITSKFTPPPQPGGISKAPAPELFAGGTPYILPGAYIGTPQAPGPSLAQTGEVFGIYHKLVVHGALKKTGTWFWDHDIVNFYPPQPFFGPSFLYVRRAAGALIVPLQLKLPPKTGPLTVTIAPVTMTTSGVIVGPSKIVSLNGAPAGTAITVTFGIGETVKNVSIVGLPPGGGFVLFMSCKGCQLGGVGGDVS